MPSLLGDSSYIMRLEMPNNITPVATWRDHVSETLGSLTTTASNIEKKLDKACEVMDHHEVRIDALEDVNEQRSAVQKKIGALYAAIITIVTLLANIAWKIIK